MAVSLWSSTDRRLTFILGIAVLLTGLSVAAPMPFNQNPDEFWTNSCGRQIRHSRSSGIATNKNSIKVFIRKIEEYMKDDLVNVYPHIIINESIRSSNIFNVKAFIKHLNKFKGAKEATENFYQIIIKLGKFIDKLMAVPVKTDTNLNLSARHNIYENARLYLRTVVCEFNSTLTDYYENHSGAKETAPEVPNFNEEHLPESFDTTTAQMMDIDFFKKLRNFFKRSLKVLKTRGMKRNGKKKNAPKKISKKRKEGNKNKKAKGRKRTKNSQNVQ